MIHQDENDLDWNEHFYDRFSSTSENCALKIFLCLPNWVKMRAICVCVCMMNFFGMENIVPGKNQ